MHLDYIAEQSVIYGNGVCMSRKYALCLPLLTAVMLLAGCARTELSRNPSDLSGAEQASGEEAQPLSFEAQDMGGNTVSADIFSEAELTMVNVWATYCNPCLREMPGLGELAGEYESGEFQILGIISDVPEGTEQKTLDLVAELIDKTGADYPHLLLNKSLYDALLTDVTAVPTTFFIDQDGTILEKVIGSMEKSAWEEKINALLEKE